MKNFNLATNRPLLWIFIDYRFSLYLLQWTWSGHDGGRTGRRWGWRWSRPKFWCIHVVSSRDPCLYTATVGGDGTPLCRLSTRAPMLRQHEHILVHVDTAIALCQGTAPGLKIGVRCAVGTYNYFFGCCCCGLFTHTTWFSCTYIYVRWYLHRWGRLCWFIIVAAGKRLFMFSTFRFFVERWKMRS